LDGLLSRLDNLSRKPEFMLQRELARAHSSRSWKGLRDGSSRRLSKKSNWRASICSATIILMTDS
jgi:hypothetical protein